MASTSDVQTICRGSFNQGNLSIFPGDTAGKQCIANVFSTGVYASCVQNPKLWKQSDLDGILLQGDYLYNQVCKKNSYLLPSDIPECIQVFGEVCTILQGDDLYGIVEGDTSSILDSICKSEGTNSQAWGLRILCFGRENQISGVSACGVFFLWTRLLCF